MRQYKPYTSKAFKSVLCPAQTKGELGQDPKDMEEIQGAKERATRKAGLFPRSFIPLRALLLAVLVNIALVLALNMLVKADFKQSAFGRICYIFLCDSPSEGEKAAQETPAP